MSYIFFFLEYFLISFGRITNWCICKVKLRKSRKLNEQVPIWNGQKGIRIFTKKSAFEYVPVTDSCPISANLNKLITLVSNNKYCLKNIVAFKENQNIKCQTICLDVWLVHYISICAIITHSLYIFHPIFEDHFFVIKELFSEFFSIQEWFLIRSRLW